MTVYPPGQRELPDGFDPERAIPFNFHCERCKYNLKFLPYLGVCPECGTHYNARSPIASRYEPKGVTLPDFPAGVDPERTITYSVFCGQCGYNLRYAPFVGNCPECGHTYNARPHVQDGIFRGDVLKFPMLDMIVVVGVVLFGGAVIKNALIPRNEALLVVGGGFIVMGSLLATVVYKEIARCVRFRRLLRRAQEDAE